MMTASSVVVLGPTEVFGQKKGALVQHLNPSFPSSLCFSDDGFIHTAQYPIRPRFVVLLFNFSILFVLLNPLFLFLSCHRPNYAVLFPCDFEKIVFVFLAKLNVYMYIYMYCFSLQKPFEVCRR